MKKNANADGDYTCDQFYQVRVCTERDADCAECLQKRCRPCLRPVETGSQAVARISDRTASQQTV